MVKIEQGVINQLVEVRKLRKLSAIEEITGIKSETLARLIRKRCATDKVAGKINAFFSQKPGENKDVIEVICQHYNLSPAQLIQKGNHEARQIAAFIKNIYRGESYVQVARDLSYKDHTGARVAVTTISDRLETEMELRRTISTINEKLNS